MRPETLSRKIRERFFYSVADAGKLVGLKRTQAYRAARLGQIPTEREGKLLLVPRKLWDRKVRQLTQGSP